MKSAFFIIASFSSFILLSFYNVSKQAPHHPKLEYHTIKSEILGYDIAYQVMLPPHFKKSKKYPSLYITDGRTFLESTNADKLIYDIHKENLPTSFITIFVHSIDVIDSTLNRRNEQFFCNEKYLFFFEKELIPTIDKMYPTLASGNQRYLMGFSFGGLNALYFALYGNSSFGNIAALSPITYPCPDIHQKFILNEKKAVRIFMSTGKNDAENYTEKVKIVLDIKGYDYRYIENEYGHDFENWASVINKAIGFFLH